MTLNIVYTPGTVAPLAFMLRSVLHWSDCSFRLVANACLPPERRFLERLAARHSRVEFHPLPTEKVWRHGDVLNYLQSMEQGEYFGFMDSDILATGSFLPLALDRLGQCAAVFSGSPVWTRARDRVMPDQFMIASGPYTRTAAGHDLGNTYFAIYDNAILTSVRQEYGVGFEEAGWEDITEPHRKTLTARRLDKRRYDTGKLLNVLMLAHGHSLASLEIPALTHIGGISFVPLRSRRPRWWSGLATWTGVDRLRSRLGVHRGLTRAGISGDEARAEATVRLDQRNVVRQYFWQLLQSLSVAQDPPPLPVLGDPELRQQVALASQAVIAAHREFGGQGSEVHS